MELTLRQKKLLGAVARGFVDPGKVMDDAQKVWQAAAPILNEAVQAAAPEFKPGEVREIVLNVALALGDYAYGKRSGGVMTFNDWCETRKEAPAKKCAKAESETKAVLVPGRYSGAAIVCVPKAAAKTKAPAKRKTKAAVPKHGHPCEGCPDCEKAGTKAAMKKAKAPVKAGTELDLFKKAAAKAKAAPKKGKKTIKKAAKRAAAILILAAAALFGAGAAELYAGCPGGSCPVNQGSNGGAAYPGYYYSGWNWWNPYGWAWIYPNNQAKPADGKDADADKPAADDASTDKTGKDADAAQELDEIPEWIPIDTPADEQADADPEITPRIEIAVCPLAATLAVLINDARTNRGLPALTLDPDLSAACERHSAYMKERGFGHAADGGKECIAEGYATPADAVAAWLGSAPHAEIILGTGARLGVGVVGRFYTLRIR